MVKLSPMGRAAEAAAYTLETNALHPFATKPARHLVISYYSGPGAPCYTHRVPYVAAVPVRDQDEACVKIRWARRRGWVVAEKWADQNLRAAYFQPQRGAPMIRKLYGHRPPLFLVLGATNTSGPIQRPGPTQRKPSVLGNKHSALAHSIGPPTFSIDDKTYSSKPMSLGLLFYKNPLHRGPAGAWVALKGLDVSRETQPGHSVGGSRLRRCSRLCVSVVKSRRLGDTLLVGYRRTNRLDCVWL